jgi:hypothetical protein
MNEDAKTDTVRHGRGGHTSEPRSAAVRTILRASNAEKTSAKTTKGASR